MSTSKKPPEGGGPRKRGRPTQHIRMTTEQAGEAIDRMLGKEPVKKDSTRTPIVRSKKKQRGA